MECRRVWRPSSLSAVTMATVAPSGRGRSRSLPSPFTLAMMAAFARPGPMSAARSTPVAPSGRVRVEPSGRVMVRSAMVIPRLATPLRPRFDG